MENINIINNKLTFRNKDYDIISYSYPDSENIEVNLLDYGIINFILSELTITGEIDYFNDFSSLKKKIIEIIDENTVLKINNGFSFANKNFSLSLSAQINWSNLLLLPGSFFPINLSTKNDDIYQLTYNNVQLFYSAALNGKNTPLQEGNILKQQVKNALTLQELQQIINNL